MVVSWMMMETVEMVRRVQILNTFCEAEPTDLLTNMWNVEERGESWVTSPFFI